MFDTSHSDFGKIGDIEQRSIMEKTSLVIEKSLNNLLKYILKNWKEQEKVHILCLYI